MKISVLYRRALSVCALPAMLTGCGDRSRRSRIGYDSAKWQIKSQYRGSRFADRLRERRKSNMTIITAVMRKLLTLAYGVLKSGRFFDPSYASP
jgi:transposase